MKIQIVYIYESLGTLVNIDFSASTLQFNLTLLMQTTNKNPASL